MILCLLVLTLTAEPNAVAATVNGETIRLVDVDALLARHKPPGPITATQTAALRRLALDELIDETLLTQYLAKHGPASDAAELDKHIAALVEVQKKQGKSLKDFTRETGLSEAQLRSQFDTAIRWRKLVESRTTEKQFRAYFDANRLVFDGATVRLAHIRLPLKVDATDGEIAAATETLRALKTDIDAGRSTFATAARRHSLSPSAKVGGDLGEVGRKDGQVEEVLAAAAFALPLNVVSDPVRGTDGVHLLQVTARSPGTPATYEKMMEAVKEAYCDEARSRLFLELRKTAELRVSLP